MGTDTDTVETETEAGNEAKLDNFETEVTEESPPQPIRRGRNSKWAAVHKKVSQLDADRWLKVMGLSKKNATSLRTSIANKRIAKRTAIVANDELGEDGLYTVWILRESSNRPLEDATSRSDSTTLTSEAIDNELAVDNELAGLTIDPT